MKLVSFRDVDGAPGVGVVEGDRLSRVDLPGSPLASPMRRLLVEHGEDLLAGIRTVGAPVALDSVTLQPIVPDPGKVVAAPVNYRDHQEEMRESACIDALGVFLKAPTSVAAHGGVVRLPYTDRRFDQEGELAAVIGRRTRDVEPGAALGSVAGYTVLLDMTMRGGEDRSTRKSFDTFTPVGPWLITPDEAPDPSAMRLRTWVGGELRQDADVGELIWDLPRLISYISSVMTLQPGDIVTTGTPAGIGEVHDGDPVVAEIDGVGRLEISVSAEGAVPCPTRGARSGPKPPATVTPVRER